MSTNEPWYAIRSTFRIGVKDDSNIYEERIVVFRAESIEEAFSKAKKEAEQYEYESGFEWIGQLDSYHIFDPEEISEGREVWSEYQESELNADEFLNEKYQRFTYHPPK